MSDLFIDTFTVNRDTAVLNLKGFIDSTNASKLKESIESVVQNNRYKLIIDFKGIDYVSSAGWGVLIGKIRDIREHQGDLILTGMTEGVYSIYKLMELDQIFKSFTTIDEALIVFGKHGIRLEKQVLEKIEIKEKGIQKEFTIEKPSKEITKQSSLEEEIRNIIAETPLISLKSLSDELMKKSHGEWKVGWLRLKKLLKAMDLGSVTKRLYYAFQKAKGE